MSAHILVVEPETALQAALSSWLEWEGYDCACASDPEEALAIAEHDRADVALVSDHAAAWDACGLAGELKSLREDLAIIVLCGAGRRRCRVERSLDVIEEIPAPITRGAVTQAVTRAVRWREAPAAGSPGLPRVSGGDGAPRRRTPRSLPADDGRSTSWWA